MINEDEVLSYLNTKNKPGYSRTNYDHFLKHLNYKFSKDAIHITGTNGKGSVTYFLSATLIKAGFKVGRFISPILHRPHEMISVNNEDISMENFLLILNEYYDSFETFDLSYFEIITFIALVYFERQKVDLAIIEVGMGGKIDATNIFKPILSIITNVTLEHTSFLGKTVKEIATHKAGIIKNKTPILVGNLSLEAFNVVASVAMKKEAPLYVVKNPTNIKVTEEGLCFDALDYKGICLAIPASYEAQNAALVLNALEIIGNKFRVESKTVFEAFKAIKIPARFSIIQTKPHVIVDGAHNPAAIAALINSVKAFDNHQIHVVFAAFKDKDVKQELDLFALANANLVLTTFNHKRARTKEDYLGLEYEYYENYIEAIKTTIKKASKSDVVLITGSLHFALQVYENFAEGVLK